MSDALFVALAFLAVAALVAAVKAWHLWRAIKRGPCHAHYPPANHPDYTDGMAYCRKCGTYYRPKPQLSATALRRMFGD